MRPGQKFGKPAAGGSGFAASRVDTPGVAWEGAEPVRINRKTAMALAASAALVVGSGFVASAAVLHIPLFGFGHEATRSAASSATATTPPVSVVDQTVYDDHYVTTPASTGAATVAATVSVPTTAAAVSASALNAPLGAAQAVSAPPSTTPPATTATTAPAPPTPTSGPGTTSTTRPAPPAGCREPEWDPEYHVWQCSTGGH